MQNPFDDLSLERNADVDCGCGGQTAMFADSTLPPPAELESALDQYLSVGATADAELELALDDDLMFAENELALPDVAGGEEVELKTLIALAEQNPGLKISISFG